MSSDAAAATLAGLSPVYGADELRAAVPPRVAALASTATTVPLHGDLVLSACASTIQMAARRKALQGRAHRRRRVAEFVEAKRPLRAARLIQRAASAKVIEPMRQRRRSAAVSIQKLVRGMTGRSLLRKARQDKAATAIQTMVRGRQARAEVKSRRREARIRQLEQKHRDEMQAQLARKRAEVVAQEEDRREKRKLREEEKLRRAAAAAAMVASAGVSVGHLPNGEQAVTRATRGGRAFGAGLPGPVLKPLSPGVGSPSSAGAGTGAGAGAGLGSAPAASPATPSPLSVRPPVSASASATASALTVVSTAHTAARRRRPRPFEDVDVPATPAHHAGGVLPGQLLLMVADMLTPADESAAAGTCRYWRDCFSVNPRWRQLFEALYWDGPLVGSAMTAVSALAPVTYRQLFGEAQLQVPNGYGPMAPPNRNLACLCGEVFTRGMPPWPHNVATATLVYLCLLQGARPAGTHFSSLASLPSELFTQWSPVMVDLLLKADPYLPQDTADRLLSTMCARAQHNAHTVAVCELLAPLHSGATSLPTGVLLSYSSTRKAATASSTRGSGASGAPGPTRTRLENLPPLASVFVQTAEHTPATAQLVKLLLTKQPSEVLRHPLPLLLGLALRSAQVHTASTATVVKALIDAHDEFASAAAAAGGSATGGRGSRPDDATPPVRVAALGIRSPHGRSSSYGSPTKSWSARGPPVTPSSASASPASTAVRSMRSPSGRRSGNLHSSGRTTPSSSARKSRTTKAGLADLASPKVRVHRTYTMGEPLRLACSPGGGRHTPASVDIVRAILHVDPTAAAQRVSDGRLAMHFACGVHEHTASTVDIVNILIGAHRLGASAPIGGTDTGRLPIHVAAVRKLHTSATVNVVKALLRVAPATARCGDPQHARRMPEDLVRGVAKLSPEGATVARLLARARREAANPDGTPITKVSKQSLTALATPRASPGSKHAASPHTLASTAARLSSARTHSGGVGASAGAGAGGGGGGGGTPVPTLDLSMLGVIKPHGSPGSVTSASGPPGPSPAELAAAAPALLDPVKPSAANPAALSGGIDNIDTLDADEYDAEVTAEARAMYATALATGRFSYMAPETAELAELVAIKAYEGKWRENQELKLQAAAEVAEEQRAHRQIKLEAIAQEKDITRAQAAVVLEAMEHQAALDAARKEAEREAKIKLEEERKMKLTANRKKADVRRKVKSETQRLKDLILSGQPLSKELLLADNGSLASYTPRSSTSSPRSAAGRTPRSAAVRTPRTRTPGARSGR